MSRNSIPDKRKLLNALLRNNLDAYCEKVFHTLFPGKPFYPNWHLSAITHRLLQVRSGEVRRLIISQPPRSLKTICTSVAFPSWWLGQDPSHSFAIIAYNQELVKHFARQFRTVIESDWFGPLNPKCQWSRITDTEFATTKGGGLFAASVGGTLTGRGADTFIIGDPSKADAAGSEASRFSTNEWFSTTLISRQNDKRTASIIVVAQRLHEFDLPGQLLASGSDWTELRLPAIAECDEIVPIGPERYHRRKAGEALQSTFEPLEALAVTKRTMGSQKFSAQFQQRPLPFEGNLIKRDWIKEYVTAPSQPQVHIVQSWDVASTIADASDYSACSTWAMVNRQYFLLHVWRGRLEFPQLRHKFAELGLQYRPRHILIEHAGPGIPLIQELRANPIPGMPLPIGIRPEGDKKYRMAAQAARFEAGQVFFPKDAPWLSDLLHELLGFPAGRHDDQVDSVTQFLAWAEQPQMGIISCSLFAPKIIGSSWRV